VVCRWKGTNVAGEEKQADIWDLRIAKPLSLSNQVSSRTPCMTRQQFLRRFTCTFWLITTCRVHADDVQSTRHPVRRATPPPGRTLRIQHKASGRYVKIASNVEDSYISHEGRVLGRSPFLARQLFLPTLVYLPAPRRPLSLPCLMYSFRTRQTFYLWCLESILQHDSRQEAQYHDHATRPRGYEGI
jgi:hypothetical protein